MIYVLGTEAGVLDLDPVEPAGEGEGRGWSWGTPGCCCGPGVDVGVAVGVGREFGPELLLS